MHAGIAGDADEVAHSAGWLWDCESGAAHRRIERPARNVSRERALEPASWIPIQFVEHGTEQPVEQVTVPSTS